LRVSDNGQVEGDGFPRQLKAIEEYAAAHDVRIVRVFREEGMSGANPIPSTRANGAKIVSR
jgi:DNA invertase Pin-like site-specific DNA recombinase